MPFSKGYDSETKHFWPYVGEAKMCSRGSSFFLKNCKQTAEKSKQIFENKKNTAYQTHFSFTNKGSEVLSFKVIALIKGQLWSW